VRVVVGNLPRMLRPCALGRPDTGKISGFVVLLLLVFIFFAFRGLVFARDATDKGKIRKEPD